MDTPFLDNTLRTKISISFNRAEQCLLYQSANGERYYVHFSYIVQSIFRTHFDYL